MDLRGLVITELQTYTLDISFQELGKLNTLASVAELNWSVLYQSLKASNFLHSKLLERLPYAETGCSTQTGGGLSSGTSAIFSSESQTSPNRQPAARPNSDVVCFKALGVLSYWPVLVKFLRFLVSGFGLNSCSGKFGCSDGQPSNALFVSFLFPSTSCYEVTQGDTEP